MSQKKLHVINVSNMKNMLTSIPEEEATIYVCIACKTMACGSNAKANS